MVTQDIILLISVSATLLLTVSNIMQRGKNNTLLDEIQKLKKDKKTTQDQITDIVVGDRVVIPNYDLIMGKGTDEEFSFSVDFELEVLEVANDMLKVKTTGFKTTSSKINGDPSTHAGIKNFLNEKWVKKKEVHLIYDDTRKRNAKLENLLEA